jgi:hypothetical protein
MAEDFKVYKAEDLRKINAQRRGLSAPGEYTVPVLTEGSVLFSPASDAHDEPRACMNCELYNAGKSCAIMGPHIPIRKLTFPKEPTADAKVIEYWPVCGYWMYGEPYSSERFFATVDPDAAGLGWVNAPKPGLTHSGSCCGGRNGGDECDYWVTEVADARIADSGFCRVLQKDTSNMDCCSAWQDDDWLEWRRGVEILNGED